LTDCGTFFINAPEQIYWTQNNFLDTLDSPESLDYPDLLGSPGSQESTSPDSMGPIPLFYYLQR